MTTLLCRTHDIYDQLYNDYRKQHGGRKPNPDKTAELWNEASGIAAREQAQTIINQANINALMDAPLLAPTQSREAATWDAIRDVRRAARDAQKEAQR